MTVGCLAAAAAAMPLAGTWSVLGIDQAAAVAADAVLCAVGAALPDRSRNVRQLLCGWPAAPLAFGGGGSRDVAAVLR
ncbi:hypothetical protein [Nakamurella endophytica]|uniref:Uncharacterized protein n=1 Tax=Nakamurella endophytica TaxID=1748367 RepID=A0A917T9Z9_9ACTN|nr:hypothetical protein [Nakamurella endophytica]GGM15964.1 hypothetical protein GCM10011594_39960 [Nakamurella endophytica]